MRILYRDEADGIYRALVIIPYKRSKSWWNVCLSLCWDRWPFCHCPWLLCGYWNPVPRILGIWVLTRIQWIMRINESMPWVRPGHHRPRGLDAWFKSIYNLCTLNITPVRPIEQRLEASHIGNGIYQQSQSIDRGCIIGFPIKVRNSGAAGCYRNLSNYSQNLQFGLSYATYR